VLATATGAADYNLRQFNDFDWVIIDEAAQGLEAACWIAIQKGKRVFPLPSFPLSSPSPFPLPSPSNLRQFTDSIGSLSTRPRRDMLDRNPKRKKIIPLAPPLSPPFPLPPFALSLLLQFTLYFIFFIYFIFYILYFLYFIFYLLFVICYLLFVICYLLFVICYLLFVICYFLYYIFYLYILFIFIFSFIFIFLGIFLLTKHNRYC
jgi:hypothetical protein